MTTPQLQFLELLRSGIWNKTPDLALFDENTDWKEIYEQSRRQALLAVVLDGVNKLPDNIRPARPLYLKWCADALVTEDANEKLNEEVVNLFKMLRENGINPVLMKGQSLSHYYPNPAHRTCGDIDIFIGKKNYKKVCDLLALEGHTDDKVTAQHISYDWHGVEVENHYQLAKRYSPIVNRHLTNIVDKTINQGKYGIVEINGYLIDTIPTSFYAAYLLLHSIQHLMYEGIGLRQICDWSLFINYNHKDLHWSELIEMLKKLDLINGWRIFGALAVKYLGLPKEDLFINFTEEDEKEAEILMKDVFYNGNFGTHGEMLVEKPKGFFKQRIFNYKHGLNRKYSLKKIAPSDARWWPLIHIWKAAKVRLIGHRPHPINLSSFLSYL